MTLGLCLDRLVAPYLDAFGAHFTRFHIEGTYIV